ncbi:hypothetical protein MG296_14315 [Flavobacteriaceae bacterium TK19130]|nr:hypothetical protein [Thermobacterium salinum]
MHLKAKMIRTSTILSLIYVIWFVIISWYENLRFGLIIISFPFLIIAIKSYLQFEKTFDNERYIRLTKSDFDFWKIGIALLVMVICIWNIDIYFGIVFVFAGIYLYTEYTISKNRIIKFDENGFDVVGKEKHRGIEEISSIEIHPNNVEIRFREYEILQINKYELIDTKWESFIERINGIKTHANNV